MSTWFDIESIQNQASKILEDVNKLDVFNEEQQKNTIANKKLAAITNDFVVTNAVVDEHVANGDVDSKDISTSMDATDANIDNQTVELNQVPNTPFTEIPSVLSKSEIVFNQPAVSNNQLSTPNISNDFVVKEVKAMDVVDAAKPSVSKFNNMVISAMSIIHYNTTPATPSTLLSEKNTQKVDMLLGNYSGESRALFELEPDELERADPILQKIQMNKENARNGIYPPTKKPNFYTQSSKYQQSPLIRTEPESSAGGELGHWWRGVCSAVYAWLSTPLAVLTYRLIEAASSYLVYLCTSCWRYDRAEAQRRWAEVCGAHSQLSSHLTHSLTGAHEEMDLITFVEYLTSPAGFGKRLPIYI